MASADRDAEGEDGAVSRNPKVASKAAATIKAKELHDLVAMALFDELGAWLGDDVAAEDTVISTIEDVLEKQGEKLDLHNNTYLATTSALGTWVCAGTMDRPEYEKHVKNASWHNNAGIVFRSVFALAYFAGIDSTNK